MESVTRYSKIKHEASYEENTAINSTWTKKI